MSVVASFAGCGSDEPSTGSRAQSTTVDASIGTQPQQADTVAAASRTTAVPPATSASPTSAAPIASDEAEPTAESTAAPTETSASTAEAPGSDDTVASTNDACRLLTLDEAEAALGREVELRVIEIGGGLTLCDYYAVNEDAGPASIHASVLAENVPKDIWESAQRAEGYEEVAGVGELAFYDDDKTLEVFADGKWISIEMINSTRFSEVLSVLTDVGIKAVERL
ncbi:MAG: hypothetical protein ABIR32_21300 [Ilumatobacteraceae bacterium]